MSSGFMQAQAIEQAHATAQPDQLPPMTAEAARRLAAALAPHWLAMRVVTAGTPYGAPAGTGPAATNTAATSTAATNTAAAAQLPPASAATTIFIAGMLERISA
jgi:hypothetical protein